MSNSYTPLYRKYRPQQFKDLVGQEAIVKTLSNALELNKVAHAYLFTGPRGTGKTSAARIFAKSLNCEKGPTLEPCGVCPSCTDITTGSAIDVIEIDAASNRKVEDARNLLEKVQFVPVSGKYKIYIIDEVHMLTTEAFNTLLKTLEEPPPNLVFILATTEAHKVLNTIISRCQRFDFRRIRQDLIVQRLKEIIQLESLNINDKALALIARRSGGGLRDALSLLDQVSILASIQNEVTEKDILTLLGCLQEDTLAQMTEAIADKNTKELVTILDDVMQSGNEPVQVIREMMNHFRNLLLSKTTNNLNDIKSIVDVSEQFYDVLKKQSEKFEPLEITQIVEKLSNYEKTIKNSSQQHLWLELALISISNRHDIQVIKDLEDRITKLEEAISTGNIPQKTSQPVPTPMPTPKPQIEKPPELAKPEPLAVKKVEIADTSINKQEEPKAAHAETMPQNATASGNVLQDWKTLLDNVDRNELSSKAFFEGLSKPVEVSAERIIITFKNEAFVKQAQNKISAIEHAASKLYGTMPKILVRTPIPQDEKIIATSKPPEPAKKENVEQITQEFEEIQKPVTAKVIVSEDPIEPMDEEIADEIKETEKSVKPVDLSDSARMVLDLFNGKIIQE